MSESVILVCDVCGSPAEEGVVIRAHGRNLAKDLCGAQRELLSGTHAPKRGRRPGRANGADAPRKVPSARGPRSKRSSTKRAAAKRTSAKRTSAKRTSAKRA